MNNSTKECELGEGGGRLPPPGVPNWTAAVEALESIRFRR